MIKKDDWVLIERCPFEAVNGLILQVEKLNPRNNTVTVTYNGEATLISRAYCKLADPPAEVTNPPPSARQAIDQVIDGKPARPVNPYRRGDRVIYKGVTVTVLGGVTGEPDHIYFKPPDSDQNGIAPVAEVQPAPPPVPVVEAELVLSLADLESEIQAGIDLIEAGRQRVWVAVSQIRARELWRDAGHKTFEAYCKNRWGWERTNAHDNARAGDVVSDLIAAGVPIHLLPTSVSQALELARVEPAARPDVIDQALEDSGNLTAAALKQARQAVTGQRVSGGRTSGGGGGGGGAQTSTAPPPDPERAAARQQIEATVAAFPVFKPGDRALAVANLQDPPDGQEVTIQAAEGNHFYQTDQGRRHASQLQRLEVEEPPAGLTPGQIEAIAKEAIDVIYNRITERCPAYSLEQIAAVCLGLEDTIREEIEHGLAQLAGQEEQ